MKWVGCRSNVIKSEVFFVSKKNPWYFSYRHLIPNQENKHFYLDSLSKAVTHAAFISYCEHNHKAGK